MFASNTEMLLAYLATQHTTGKQFEIWRHNTGAMISCPFEGPLTLTIASFDPDYDPDYS
jgi:hypothetical protein